MLNSLESLRDHIEKHYALFYQETERLYARFWGNDNNNILLYEWFESFANVLNNKMNSLEEDFKIIEIFGLLGNCHAQGDKALKTGIDVSVVENLFRNVSKKGTVHYWPFLPSNLRVLYLAFHGKTPL